MQPETRRVDSGRLLHVTWTRSKPQESQQPFGQLGLEPDLKNQVRHARHDNAHRIVNPHFFFSIIPRRKMKSSSVMGINPNLSMKKA